MPWCLPVFACVRGWHVAEQVVCGAHAFPTTSLLPQAASSGRRDASCSMFRVRLHVAGQLARRGLALSISEKPGQAPCMHKRMVCAALVDDRKSF